MWWTRRRTPAREVIHHPAAGDITTAKARWRIRRILDAWDVMQDAIVEHVPPGPNRDAVLDDLHGCMINATHLVDRGELTR